MLLHVDPYNNTVQVENKNGLRGTIEFNRYYDIFDAEGCKAIVRNVGENLLVEIKQGKKRVQYGSLPYVSADGRPFDQSYSVELRPDKVLFPVAPLIETVIGMGVERGQINPMFEESLSKYVDTDLSLKMLSDGNVDREDLPATSSFQCGATIFTVEDASWAILTSDGEIQHVYVWMSAVETENAAALLEKLQQIQAGELTKSV